MYVVYDIMITSKNIFRHELIGLYLEVVDSSNKSLIGLCGNVVDETKKTLSIDVSHDKIRNDLNQNTFIGQKMIPKKIQFFILKFQMVNGLKLKERF